MFSNSNTAVLERTEEALFPATPKFIPQDNEPLDILLVEDMISDALLARISLDGTKIPYKLRTMRKGNEVLPCLWNHRHSGQNKMPDLIMLDLGLPGMDGFEILAGLTAAPAAIRAVPIVILTGHEHFSYLQKSYNLCIAAYIPKPCNIEKMREVMLRIGRERRLFSELQ